MVSGSLALLYFLLGFHGGRQGSSPDRGVHSPLWSSQPGLRPSQPGLRPSQPGLRPSQPGLRPSQPGLRPRQPGMRSSQPASLRLQAWLAGPGAWLTGPEAWLAGPQAWLAGPQAWLEGPEGGRTDKRKIFPFYRTSSPIRAAALPATMKNKEKVEQGKGTADHLMPLGYFILLNSTGNGKEILINK